MKALTFTGIERISYETIADPSIVATTDVVVKVKLCAICGSDLHVYHGRETGCDHHTAMGHEFVGEVVEVGKEIRQLQVGDLVMCPFTTSCGHCYFCQRGLTCRCVHSQLFGWVEKGKGLQGGQAEFVRVPLADTTLMKIPPGISLEEGLLLGDILSTGFYCAHQAEIKPADVHVVVGCGPVGLLAVLGASQYGSEKLYAIDTIPERLAMAARLGATVINASSQNPQAVIHDVTEGRGADAVMEAVGSKGAGALAYDLVRPGGIISTVGVCTDDQFAFSPVQAYNKNLTYKVGRCPARFMMEQLVPWVQEKRFDSTAIITHRMKLSEGVHGYDIFANKKENCLKVVLSA
jgi:threonine dehydrogenase-like Zn-dependent dehydrogenase